MSFRERYLNRHMLLEIAPIAVFFGVNMGWDLMVATAALMVATAICVAIGWAADRHIPVFGLVTVTLVLLLGGLGLALDDALYIQIKPTIAQVLFGLILACGLLLTPSILERGLASQIKLTKQGWRVLTWRWVGLALAWAAANEIARLTLSTDDWVTFRLIMSIGAFVLYVIITRITAPRYWDGPLPT